MRPLYLMDQQVSPPKIESSGNLGLWYDKFYDQWERPTSSSIKNPSDHKIRWIQKAVDLNEGLSHEHKKMADELISRVLELVHGVGGLFLVFETTSSFVTGLGLGHPIENGFIWHSLLGAPYIPGPTLKGQLKAWPQWSGETESEFSEVLDRITILDSLPLLPVTLRGEVMTPHHSQYYRDGSPPADYDSPIPIAFLTVAPGQEFLMAALGSKDDLKVLEKYWDISLEYMGIGAKTSSGFGRFQRNKAKEKVLRLALEQKAREIEQQRQLAGLVPWEREMWEDGYYDDADKFIQALGAKWLDRLENASTEEADRTLIAERLHLWYENNRRDQWQKPNKKNAEKIGRIKKYLPSGPRQ